MKGVSDVYEAEKKKLYERIEALTGIKRKRDTRLEKIAEDRALEARYQVGISGTTPISHPIQQLQARTWPLQGTFKGVWENATWHYYPPTWVDPIDALIDGTLTNTGIPEIEGDKVGWWNSAPHKTNLLNPDATTYGIGLVKQEMTAPTAPRWYAITVFTKDLEMDVVVVNGTTFPDALSAGPLAAELNAPILLVGKDTVPTPVKNYLTTLKPTRIIVIGGIGVVSQACVAELSKFALVERIAGINRYETSVKVAEAGD
jgi:ribosome modulation factor